MERYKMINDAGVPDSLIIPVKSSEGKWIKFKDAENLEQRLAKLEHKLNLHIAVTYGLDKDNLKRFLSGVD